MTCLAVPGWQSKGQKPKEVVKAVHTIQGKPIAFEMGDYLHAIVKVNGADKSFFLSKPGLDFFLAMHCNQRGTFRYEVVDTYVPEAGGRVTINRLSDATIGGHSYSAWWENAQRRSSMKELTKKYEPLVEKYTRT